MKLVCIETKAASIELVASHEDFHHRDRAPPAVSVLFSNYDWSNRSWEEGGRVFEVDDEDVDRVVQLLAMSFPGKEIRTYTLTGAATCPPGAIVHKKISKEGSLPF